MVAKRCRNLQKLERAKSKPRSIPMDVLLSKQTMDTVVVFSSSEDFLGVSNEALKKQGLALLPVNSPARLTECCSSGYLNFLVDCGGLGFKRARSITMSIRSHAPSSFIIAYCPDTAWSLPLRDAGASAVIEGRNEVGLRVMEASTGFFENITAIIFQHLQSTRRKIKEAASQSRIAKAKARVTHLSLMHMLQTDANVRAFLTNPWPASRHGQYVAIAGGETIGFADNAEELAEQISSFRPPGNILIQKIDCEDDLLRQRVI